ncbi:GMC family oxidoreductase [Kaistella sp. G5-32]|uniref:GMC family oxidoreductase n=1 Tax=Kaistella gelatinilytica TaxID=2787636 RepID=A0ABS0F9Y9_9FLAO|nr:GMC family oxidoreductase [Kaistella gelatinilytica]MBF8456465.1 GMC family oxidoreductase [Kaistella gelatinilytica]
MLLHYDYIIIGTGAGGGTIAKVLADTGKSILILERGGFLPQEKENWDSGAVFQEERYHTKEVWKDKEGNDLHPGTGYWIGGNTKVYGAALFRLRERDFGELQHCAGISPSWPLKYDDFEKYYDQAEKLFDVHGKTGEDPTEPFRSEPLPFEGVADEPRIADVRTALKNYGLKPFDIPLGIKLNERNRVESLCIKCDTCDGFPCLLHAKADADINCIRPIMHDSNITLMIDAMVEKLITNEAGDQIRGVETVINGEKITFTAETIIVSCGAINSAALFLKSANEKHPNGLANKSDQVGRNFMKHQSAAMLAISFTENPTKFQKTIALTDFYFGDEDFGFPMGSIQLMGKSNRYMLTDDAPIFTPVKILSEMAQHSVDWWFTGEDLPDQENRVMWKDGKIHLNYTINNEEGFDRLIKKFSKILTELEDDIKFLPENINISKKIPLAGVAHQCGTLRFGTDPETSVLDTNCKTHEIDNLYVVDGSFFPSSGAVNPSLTIIANAIRVGEHLKSLI